HTLVVSSEDEAVAVIPTYMNAAGGLPLPKRELRVITEMYSGRAGLLVAHDDPEVVEFCLERLCRDFPPWDVFIFGVVEHSASHTAIMRAAERLRLRMRCLGTNESPYVELGDSWEKLLASLPKKMRWTIRKGESELSAQGRLEYQEV